MSRDRPASSFGVTRQLQIDAVCVEFERGLRAGQRPHMEAAIEKHEEPLRSQLLRHLLQVEFEYRKEQKDEFDVAEYLQRFPLDHSLVHIAHDEFSRLPRAPETEYLGSTPSQERLADSALSRSDSSLHGRFLPGTKIADRYRIVSLLGKGGMGEVYRADDLRLGHTVALKFLPRKLAHDRERLERFQAEVRLTRQISHPNVCRVYDMDEVDGQQFLSMEFIDGEDLRILLRRIGRLPKDKGVQIAQQLCAGLAAAHDRGVLHRDLKPANIMLDGRGHLRITDFGLAKIADEGQDNEIAGTPAYMAPEQLKRGQTTIQSDLYSLGLILHELFTGEAVHKTGSIAELIKQHEDSTPSQPSSHVDDMDPAVERVILRCLEKQPHERPKSAHAVANSLPGGDPIAAALAAGETPSPAMIAAAGGVGGLDVRIGVALVAAIVVGLIGVCWFSQYSDVNRIGMTKHPQTLADDAREIIQSFGYEEPPIDTAWGFTTDEDFTHYLNSSDTPSTLVKNIATEQPPALTFWFRQSPDFLVPVRTFTEFNSESRFTVTPHDPPMRRTGMFFLRLDSTGRLIEFRAVPPQRRPNDADMPAPDWLAMVEGKSEELLGFSLGSFTRTEPKWNPPVVCDTQYAWEGSYPIGIPIRVEVAGFRGRPVYLQVIGEWTRAEQDQGLWPQGTTVERTLGIISVMLAVLMFISACLVAHHLRTGRTDRRGAFRLAAFFFGSGMLMWLLRGSHVPTARGEMHQLVSALGDCLVGAAQLWLFYAAMEPFVRRLWPRILISWSRVLSGQLRDPLVGQHVLVGLLFGLVTWLLDRLTQIIITRLDVGEGQEYAYANYLPSLLGASQSVSGILQMLQQAIWLGLIGLFLLLILRFILRKEWLAAAGLVAVGVALVWSVIPAEWGIRAMVISLVACSLVIAVGTLIRFGLLAIVIGFFCSQLLNWPITTDTSAWYFQTGLGAILVILAIAGYGFYTSLGKRPAVGAA